MRALLALLLIPVLPGLSDELRKAAKEPTRQVAILEALPARLKTADREVREGAARVLMRIVADSDRAHLHAAAMAPLVATELKGAVSTVIVRAYDRTPSPLRAAARKALATQGGGPVTAEIARQMATDESPRARAWLALFLGRRGDAVAGPGLVRALRDPEVMVRAAAAEALTRIWRRCHGYDAGTWAKAIGAPPPRATVRGAETTPAKPGEIVTKPAPPRDPEKEIAKLVPEFYGVPLDRSLVIVVLDFSGSIRGEGALQVRRALRAGLDLLPTSRRLSVVAFDERLFTFGSRPRRMFPEAKLDLATFLEDLPPGRRTELLTPIRTGLAFAAKYGEAGAQVLIVSDGAPTTRGPSLDGIIAQVESTRGKKIRVDAAVYGGRRVGLLSWLAKETGGRVVALPALSRGR